jgi:hypothetical protein
MKSFRNYLYEVERRRQPDEDDDSERKPTKDKQKDPFADFDDLFAPRDDKLPAAPEPERRQEEPPRDDGDRRRRASQADTQRAAGNIAPNQRMRDLLGRMRDIENDPDDPGYPDPEPPQDLPDVRVNNQNLPAVAGANLRAAGVQDPDFHKVSNLPGNMSRAIRTLGRQLFRSFTTTDTNDIWMVGNLGGQGPNSRQEVNAVAGWVRNNGEDIGTGDIDFDTSIPGYQAEIQQYSAGGIRWLLVRDEFGDYIYSWPEADSVGHNRAAQIGRDRPRLGND